MTSRRIVQEAERLLEGRTLESYISRHEKVPAWSLIGLLAHASRLDLMRLSCPASPPDPNGWSGTVARLAGELLTMSLDDLALIGIQRRSLIPLELALLGNETAPPSSPAMLFDMVVGSLDRHLFPEL